jgi:hypothetical protein
MSEVIRRGFDTPGYTGAMPITEIVDAFNDVPEVKEYLVRRFIARRVMPGIEEEHYNRIETGEE